MLARAARAVGPDFERELLFFHDPKAKSHEEQGFARQPKNLIQAERACVHQQRFHECLADAASLLVVSHESSVLAAGDQVVDITAINRAKHRVSVAERV